MSRCSSTFSRMRCSNICSGRRSNRYADATAGAGAGTITVDAVVVTVVTASDTAGAGADVEPDVAAGIAAYRHNMNKLQQLAQQM